MGAAEPDFELGERAFARTYANRKAGPEIFTLLVAYLSKGDMQKEVGVKDVQNLWGRMTSILGMAYNPKYSTMAKEYGWVNSPERAVYVLSDKWRGVFEQAEVA